MVETTNLDSLANWLPVKLITTENIKKLVWHYFSNHLFTDPFFDESISKTKSHPYNSSKYKVLSDLSVLEKWGCNKSLIPKSIIFHTSRCGSTLLSQYLSLSDSNVSLSEVPIIDQFLRLVYHHPENSEATIKQLEQVVKLYGQKRNEAEKNLFLKTDSWHLYFWKVYRNLYPTASIIILYRHPLEIFVSQQKLKGLHAVPGLIPPEIMGFRDENITNLSFENYFGKVLNHYYCKIIEILKEDNNVLLINYNDGIAPLTEKFVSFVKTDQDKTLSHQFMERQKYHSKYPLKRFVEPKIKMEIPGFLKQSHTLYLEIEKIKRSKLTLDKKDF